MSKLLTSESLTGQLRELDEIKLVVTTLRIHCQNQKSANKAIKIISEKTRLSTDRVKEILLKINQ